MEQSVVGIDGAAFAHGHVVGRIEGTGAEVAPGAGLACLAADGVFRAEGVAVVLNEPQTVFVAEAAHGGKVEGVAQRVGYHDGFGARREGGFETADVDVVLRYGDIDEHGHGTVRNHGSDGGGETAGHGDDLVAATHLAVAQLGRGEGKEGQQVGAGAGVDGRTVPDTVSQKSRLESTRLTISRSSK